jgi:hypothetical protein
MMCGTNKGSAAVADRIAPGSTGVELGVWRGDTSAIFLARGLTMLHLVDPWSVAPYADVPDYLAHYEGLVGARDRDAFQAHYDRVYEGVCTRFADAPTRIWRMTSAEFFTRSWRADWVYVDGSHEYVDVLADLEASFARGLRIFGDDYGNKPGVTLAVDEFALRVGMRVDVFAVQQWELVR